MYLNIIKNILCIALLITLAKCAPEEKTAQWIIDKAIEVHGGQLYEQSTVEFDFRSRHYKLERNDGRFRYHRIYHDSVGLFYDVLDNEGFSRSLNGELVNLDAEWVRRYSNSVNSVAYFAYLPFGLNDAAVNKKRLENETIEEIDYFKVQVTFSQEGGGEDYEDVFVYWFDAEDFHLKYFGYSYLTDGGGIRFREAVNQRRENGILFSDYINYKGQKDDRDVAGLASKFEDGRLEKLSEIRLENLQVIQSKVID